jgi:hypothetical protein
MYIFSGVGGNYPFGWFWVWDLFFVIFGGEKRDEMKRTVNKNSMFFGVRLSIGLV